ncbi:hypothetical protein [Streptomyces sp. SID12488]|uniref:hypothetical protein n=1 Tax=Streptomyces sp. SID12488 TaxID=2706040 RepID=UPI0013DB386F|nr:hypothetical protein [Streptomyces sp. SID12488]NEA68417.1 hypothetical protein [Streptomyces sp. SID12488]
MANRQNRSSPDGTSGGTPAAGSADPSAAEGRSSVRRAFALGSVGADPSQALAPAVPPAAGAARGESGQSESGQSESGQSGNGQSESGGETPSRPDTSSGGAAGTGAAVTTSGTTAEGEAEASTAPAAAPAAQPEAVGRGRTQVASAAAGVGGFGASGGAAARGDGEPPSGNPKKPLLAAAAIAGSILLVVPVLILATGGSDEKKDKAAVSATDAVLGDDQPGAPQGEYAPASPTADATGKASATPSGKATEKAKPVGADDAVGAAPALTDVPVVSAPKAQKTPKASAPKKSTQKTSGTTTTNSGSVQRQPAGPAVGTAAYAVLQLADRNPGKHVCYRAYVTGMGWQGTQCDGATAGSEGQNRPIKALNIAVTGTNRVDASPWMQGTGWKGQDWKGAAVGVNLTIGTASDSAPNMGGFAISVDGAKGTICQTAHIRNGGWLERACDTPETKNNYIFGGTLSADLWLEAVRFTV